MQPDDQNHERADLEQVNAELQKSLENCRELLAECRSRLAANSDHQESGDRLASG
jgi:hypothetical protein